MPEDYQFQFGALKVYCDVARNRSFSQAAQVNHVTQSAVSQIVSQLEKRMDVQLIDRSTRPLQLTSLGRTFYEGCKSLLAQYAELEASIRCAHAEIAGTVQVAAIYSVGLRDMGQYVQRLTAEESGVQVHIEYVHPDQVYERVLEGAADLGLVSFPRPTPKLTAIAWREEEMVLVCPPRHALAQRLTAPVETLAGQRFVHFERDLIIRKKIDRFLKEHGVTVDVACEFDSIENIKQAVAVGAGAALLPEPTVRREVRTRSLIAVPLSGRPFTRPLGIIHRRRQKLSSAVRRFIDILCDDGLPPARNGDSHVASLNGHRGASRVKSRHRAAARA